MIPLGLTWEQQGWLNAALAGSHSIRIVVQLLNLSGARLADLSDRFLAGQVNVDATAEVSRACTMQLLDPNRTLSFETDSPDDSAIYMDRMIKVIYSVKVPQMNAWVDIPVFCGPIISMDRDDSIINIEAQGKEVLAKGAAWRTFTRKKNTNKVNLVRDILKELSGEDKFDFAELSYKIPADYSLGRESIPWDTAKSLTKSMSRQLFYDGRGYCRMRSLPGTPVFTFSSGNGGTVLSSPKVSYDSSEAKNTILVKGGVPKGAKSPVSASVSAAFTHPLSPFRLGRNNVPRYLLEVIQDDSIRTVSEAQALANKRLEESLLQTVEVSFDAIPIPYLEPEDLVRINTEEFSATFRLREFSIPLIAGDSMGINYTKRSSLGRARFPVITANAPRRTAVSARRVATAAPIQNPSLSR